MAEPSLDPITFGTAFVAFMDAMRQQAAPVGSPLFDRIQEHLGTNPSQLPIVTEEFDPFEHPNLQLALDAALARPGRAASLVGLGTPNKRFSHITLSDLLTSRAGPYGPGLDEGPVEYVNVHLAGDEVLPCVDLGLYFIRDGDMPLCALVMGAADGGPRQKLTVEVVAPRQEVAQAFLAELPPLMERLNVYRGHVISISPGDFGPGRKSFIAFHTLPRVQREDVILPEALLERIERHTVVFAEQAERLRAAGRSLKRGLLLYGPPGVGKTLTVEYLTNRMPGRTVILLTGLDIRFLKSAVALARKLAPSMMVVEDVDLIAQDRGMLPGAATPFLFSLLNELDGLQSDTDVIFMLTTNRAESLEPALATRPGRIDLVAEFPLPDRDDLIRLLELYARGLTLEGVDLVATADRVAGATPAYVKELLRKSAVLAAAGGPMVVTQAEVDAAMEELDAGGQLARRLLGLRPAQNESAAPSSRHPSGFPVA